MKRFLPATIGCLLFLSFTPTALADGTGLSPQITKVMEVAQRGIDFAQSADNNSTMLDEAIPDFLKIQLIPLFLSVDTRYTLIEQSNAIRDQSICFRFDQFVIEQKLQEVWGLMQDAAREQRLFRLMVLQEIYAYLDARHDALMEGGLNPEVTDPGWNIPFSWELAQNPDSGDDASDEELSYYYTDYLDPSEEGYGCDAETMEEAESLLTGDAPGMQEALTSLIKGEKLAETFLKEWNSIDGSASVKTSVDQLIGVGSADANAEEKPPRVWSW